MTNNNYIPAIAIIIVILIALIGGYYMGLRQGAKTNSGTTSNIASTSAVIPAETIKYVKVYIHDGSGMVEASKAIIPIVPGSGSMKIKGEFFEADMQCIASGTVDATIYNNQVYNASGTTTILQTASYTEKGSIIKPLTIWDYLWQYGGWVLLGIKLMIG